MVTLDEVAELAMALPEVTEGESRGWRTWAVRKKAFAWERPFSKADIRRYGDEPVPEGVIVGVRTEDLSEKEAVLGSGVAGVFTIPHFDGYAAVLVQLDVVDEAALRELLVDGWLACAPAPLARAYVEAEERRPGDR